MQAYWIVGGLEVVDYYYFADIDLER